MSMIGGSVTVNDDGTHTGSGLALELYEALMASYAPLFFTGDISLQNKRYHAATSTVFGSVLVTYLQANARVPLASLVATVATSTSTGRTPNPNTAGAPIAGPATAVQLPVTDTGGATSLPVT